MELFATEAEHVEHLSSIQVVELMKRLLYAECSLTGIPLRSISVPLQITVADGGEDGRVQWTGGTDQTDYLPARLCLFQAKAQNLAATTIGAEVLVRRVHKKMRRSKGEARKKAKARVSNVLKPALKEVLSKRGSYLVFCSKPFGGQKLKKLKEAVVTAVKSAGGNPTRAAAIEVYDANKIAEWVNAHPPVAMWLAAIRRQQSLRGFMSFEGWGRAPYVHQVEWVDDDKPRFNSADIGGGSGGDAARKVWMFKEAATAVVSHLDRDNSIVRIAGPSGFGKSRFTFEVFNQGKEIADQVTRARVIYADYGIATDEVGKMALEISEKGAPAILVVDDCPDEVHAKLAEIARRSGSRLRLVTVDIETTVASSEDTLVLRLEPAADDTITAIARAAAPKLSESDARFVRELARGFPSMAVLAAQRGAVGKETIRSAEQLLDRVIWGRRARELDGQKALELLSMFEWVGIGGIVENQAAAVAQIGQMARQAFVEHIKDFRGRGIVEVRGDYARVSLIPLAASFGARRISVTSADDLLRFFQSAPDALKASLLRRLRWMDYTPEARAFAKRLLEPEVFGNLEALNTAFGAESLDRLVHVDPDLAMQTIQRLLGSLSIDQLSKIDKGRRHVVWALEKLVFRRETFEAAATLLRRLGAAETEGRIANNASGQFKQLYQLYLSGTEAAPTERLRVLDDGLNSVNERERALCIEALGKMLDTQHFSRTGGAEEIGSGKRLRDWQPKTHGDVLDFIRAAIRRLTAIAAASGEGSSTAKRLLGGHIRGLLSVLPLDELKTLFASVTANHGPWREGIEGVNKWLYFDRSKSSDGHSKAVRAYFDELMPRDPVELALIYTQGWAADFHDPERTYEADRRDGHDFEYAMRRSVALAAEISADEQGLLARAIDTFPISDARTPFAFARELARLSQDSVRLFTRSVEVIEKSATPANTQFFAGLIAGADSRDPGTARDCVRIALQSPKLKPNAIALIGAGKLQTADIVLVASLLRVGDIEPTLCAALSYGRGMDHLTDDDIAPLLEELSRHGGAGLWAAIDIVSMILHGPRRLGPPIRRALRDVLLNPALFSDAPRRPEVYHLDRVVKRLLDLGAVDGKFALALAQQCMSICLPSVHDDVFHSVDDGVPTVLRHIGKVHPSAVWNAAVPLLASKNWRVRHRVEDLIGPVSHRDHLGAGILFELPEELYLSWARKDPAHRAAVILKWLPIATKNGDLLAWHPALEKFIKEFGEEKEVLGSLGLRLHPRVWWGSLADHLGPYIRLLQDWLHHESAAVRAWARSGMEQLHKEIADSRKRDDEDAVRFS